MAPLFQHGDIVVRRNRRDERGMVHGSAKTLASRNFYNVLFPSSPNPVQVGEGDLEKISLDMSIEDRLLNREFGDQSTFSRLLTYERLRHPLQDTLYSLRASRTEFQPYQFKPLLKFLRSSKQRLLLADEVGLGKTIEAGFILCEMLARHPHMFRRALVVCKASLCIKWQMEMRKRFDLQFEIWKAQQLREYLRRYREDEDLPLRTICSLESFRNTSVMQEWEAMPPPLDVLIIDEAHHLKNSETKAHKACREAAASADAVLALTATPIQIGSRDLFNLLSLLDEEEFASFPYFEACMLFNRHVVAAEQKITQTDPNRFAVVRSILESLVQGQDNVAFPSEPILGPYRNGTAIAEAFLLAQHGCTIEQLRAIAQRHGVSESHILGDTGVFATTRRRDARRGKNGWLSQVQLPTGQLVEDFEPEDFEKVFGSTAVLRIIAVKPDLPDQIPGRSVSTIFPPRGEVRTLSSANELAYASSAVSDSLRRHPLYKETLRLLAESDPASHRATVEIQRNLAEMNFLSRVFSRTRRRDVHAGAERVAVVKKVEMTEPERGFYDAVLDFVRATYLREGKDGALLFGLMMPQRQLASCIPAMVEYYESQMGFGPGGLDSEESDSEAEDWNSNTTDQPESRRQRLLELIRSWYKTGQQDSKFTVLQQCLDELQETQPGEPVVIFSYFKKTLEYLSRRLGALGYSNTVISGSFTPVEREKRITHFREGTYQILLSSEVGSEGLDFQFCHILFNYDLPWNPMVVEQRIGRLDRFGQLAQRILIFNLSAPGTIEDEILNRLYKRIHLFEAYIGDLEAILGNEITSLTKDLFDPELSEEELRRRIDEAGLLLEKRKQQFEEWERSSPQFIGHDEYPTARK